MDEERLQVLRLLEAGTITADQAVELLNALQPTAPRPDPAWSRLAAVPRVVPPAVAPATAPYWRIGGARIRFGPGERSASTRSAEYDDWGTRSGPRWIRLRVLDGQGRSKVDVQLPIGVLGLFIRMGARWLPSLRGFDPDVVLAAVQMRRGDRGSTLFQAIDEEDGDRVEITVE